MRESPRQVAAASPPQYFDKHARNTTLMDIEQVNAIGLLLADLSDRTEQLRGYL